SFTVYTRWIEEEWDNAVPAFDGDPAEEETVPPRTIAVEVDGRRLEVSVPGDLVGTGGAARRAPRKTSGGASAAATGDDMLAPIQGTVVTVL
ncbi:MAG TPA: acetyl-/propionyl-CoA carboxylase subunit alpha, partial [Corynebacterium variabile]|nr:acetyl-/propionyl-CoA carboxylase subunit alpha [Corynebacterium variabile]